MMVGYGHPLILVDIYDVVVGIVFDSVGKTGTYVLHNLVQLADMLQMELQLEVGFEGRVVDADQAGMPGDVVDDVSPDLVGAEVDVQLEDIVSEFGEVEGDTVSLNDAEFLQFFDPVSDNLARGAECVCQFAVAQAGVGGEAAKDAMFDGIDIDFFYSGNVSKFYVIGLAEVSGEKICMPELGFSQPDGKRLLLEIGAVSLLDIPPDGIHLGDVSHAEHDRQIICPTDGGNNIGIFMADEERDDVVTHLRSRILVYVVEPRIDVVQAMGIDDSKKGLYDPFVF
jgi:hypothetical protein